MTEPTTATCERQVAKLRAALNNEGWADYEIDSYLAGTAPAGTRARSAILAATKDTERGH